jgi:hypothetical protein
VRWGRNGGEGTRGCARGFSFRRAPEQNEKRTKLSSSPGRTHRIRTPTGDMLGSENAFRHRIYRTRLCVFVDPHQRIYVKSRRRSSRRSNGVQLSDIPSRSLKNRPVFNKTDFQIGNWPLRQADSQSINYPFRKCIVSKRATDIRSG